jgi:transcriptional regulator with XRE-family HTH domain
MVNRFQEQRTKHGLTIEELSGKSGISAEELTKIESPDFDVENMSAVKAARIAESMGCLIRDLVFEP